MIVSENPIIEVQINTYFRSPHFKALAENTKALYKSVIRRKLLPFCEEYRIPRLTESFKEHMDDFADYIKNQNVSAQTTLLYLTITKLVFSFHGYHLKYTYKIPRYDKQIFDLKHQRRWFSGEDIARCKTYIFKRNHIRNHLLVRLLCETGARINEIANICVCDVKLKEKAILLSWSKTTPRPVFFTSDTAIYLEKHLKESFPNPEIDKFKKIFPGKNMIYKIIVGMLKDLNLKTKGDGRGPHTFRHYVATNLRYNYKMDLDHVARLLGDTTETISARYLHPTGEMLHSLINKASGW